MLSTILDENMAKPFCYKKKYEQGGIAIWHKWVNVCACCCRQDEAQLHDYLEGRMNVIPRNLLYTPAYSINYFFQLSKKKIS